MRCLWMVAALAAVALAGCLGGDDVDPRSVSSELLSNAKSELGDEAALYAVIGYEPSQPIPAEATEGCGSFPKSSSPMDGKPVAWFYMYGNPTTDQGLIILTDSKGSVRCEMLEDDVHISEMDPLESWSVPSEEAARIVAANVANLSTLVKDAEVFYSIYQTPDGPVWFFDVWHIMSGESMGWAVHAQTGEFLTEDIMIPDPQKPRVPMPEFGAAQGSTTGVLVYSLINPAEFTLAHEGHGTLEITVQLDDPATDFGLQYGVRVTGPGTEVDMMVSNGETITLSTPDQGDWEVRAWPAVAGANLDFTGVYCAYTDDACFIETATYAEARAEWLPAWVS